MLELFSKMQAIVLSALLLSSFCLKSSSADRLTNVSGDLDLSKMDKFDSDTDISETTTEFKFDRKKRSPGKSDSGELGVPLVDGLLKGVGGALTSLGLK